MHIGSWDSDDRVLIVAEIGNNHEGDVEVAKALVRHAAAAGADAVKFQTFQTKLFVSARDEARYARLSSFELAPRHFEELQVLARSLGLLFISTPLDLESAAVLEPLVDSYKIASGDNDFYPLIARVCRTGKPVIVSSGLSDLAQVRATQAFVTEQWRAQGIKQDVALLHCVSSYPVPPEQANLAAIPYLAAELGGVIGYSDHTIGVDACVVAVALGAQIIEKHFTLDKQYSAFRDHQLSADPPEFLALVDKVRQVRTLRGRPEKKVQSSEAPSVSLIRRSIVAARTLPRGHRLGGEDLIWIRPALGLAPGQEYRLIGRVLRRDVAFGEPILPDDVEG